MEIDGVPMPDVCTLTGLSLVGPGVAEHAAVIVDEPALLEPAIEELRDASGAIRIAGQQHQGRVVADFGAKMDLGHVSLPRRVGPWLLGRRRV